MRLRVVCGLEVTMATFCPTNRLISVDLPAFGRPIMATNPERNPWGFVCCRFSVTLSSLLYRRQFQHAWMRRVIQKRDMCSLGVLAGFFRHHAPAVVVFLHLRRIDAAHHQSQAAARG